MGHRCPASAKPGRGARWWPRRKRARSPTAVRPGHGQQFAEHQVAGGSAALEEPGLRGLQQGPPRRTLHQLGAGDGSRRRSGRAVRTTPPRGAARRASRPPTWPRVPEQAVAAIPLVLGVERHQEQVGPIQRRQHVCRAGDLQRGVAQRTGQPLQRRGPHQQVPLFGRDGRQHFRGEVAEQVPIIPANRRRHPWSAASANPTVSARPSGSQHRRPQRRTRRNTQASILYRTPVLESVNDNQGDRLSRLWSTSNGRWPGATTRLLLQRLLPAALRRARVQYTEVRPRGDVLASPTVAARTVRPLPRCTGPPPGVPATGGRRSRVRATCASRARTTGL